MGAVAGVQLSGNLPGKYDVNAWVERVFVKGDPREWGNAKHGLWTRNGESEQRDG